MSNRSRILVEAETRLIRSMLENNLSCSHQEIMDKLGISRPTYYRYIRRIMNEDAKAWEAVHLKSAKYRATQLIDCLLNCVKLSNEIMNNPMEDSRTRLEAAKTACLSYANVVKILENGPTFKLSLPIYPKDKNPELTTDNETI